MITADFIQSVLGKRLTKKQAQNVASVVMGLDVLGETTGLDRPHRAVQYICQLLHESGGLNYDREIWGPTPAQKRYEGRKVLGNTQPGDGKRFAGRTAMQITGRSNTKRFRDWCRKRVAGTSLVVPDFLVAPEAMNTDPWEGFGPIWYWDVGNPDGNTLNRYADRGDIEMVTRKINGGLNGYADRLRYYDRCALVALGFEPNAIKAFQEHATGAGIYRGKLDGISGPQTRAALHSSLLTLSAPSSDTAIAPVTEKIETMPEETEVEATKPVGRWQWFTGIGSAIGSAFAAIAGLDWQTIAAIAGAGLLFVLVLVFLRHKVADTIRVLRSELEAPK